MVSFTVCLNKVYSRRQCFTAAPAPDDGVFD